MATDTPAIAAIPYHLKPGLFPGRVALDDLVWPLGRPDRLRRAKQTLHDLMPSDHLLVFTSDLVQYRPWFGTPARVSVMVLEPEAIHGRHMRLLRWTHRRFHKVLSCNEPLLDAIPNGVLFPLGGNWAKDWQEIPHTKTRLCSLIASGKRDLEGHVLRHDTVDWVRNEGLNVDVMGRGYESFDKKSDGLSPFRYSIVIENIRERNYFTEKLIDAVLCQTVPIYWGCPNLADFMDVSGMVICETKEALRSAILDMSEQAYSTRLPGLLNAGAAAASYADIYQRAAQAVLDASS
ncbi:glycosyltransferase family 10 domain-containing protein [Roseovarius phycicola]|uniref:Glycosyltransferase family 10 n=1 Tax=Roseovarius phycicola TaxID=3080976 RepID=A0ABZ2HMY9_9RHOB